MGSSGWMEMEGRDIMGLIARTGWSGASGGTGWVKAAGHDGTGPSGRNEWSGANGGMEWNVSQWRYVNGWVKMVRRNGMFASSGMGWNVRIKSL
ncbi:unnamed protein product, partial [Allacma fusca]